MRARWIGMVAVAAVCTCSQPAHAQTATINGIAHVAFRVSDLDAEEAFFGKLGFAKSIVLTNPRATQVFIKINDLQFVELYSRNDRSQPLGWVHASFESDAVEALDALYAQRGLNPPPAAETQAHNLLFSLRDPDGRLNELTEYMPDSLQTLDQGKHLGANRVSDELLGYDLPVTNLAADKQFYTKLGFETQDVNGNVRLSLPGDADLRIELRRAHAGDQPQVLLAVPDARKAADQLHRAGLKAQRQGNLVFVNDPDGNAFVLMAIGAR